MGRFSQIRQGMAFAFAPPAVSELGNAKGFDFQLQDRGGVGHAALMNARNQLLGMAAQDPRLMAVRPNGMEDQPEYRVDVDWTRAGALGVPISTIHNTVSAAFGQRLCQRLHPGRPRQACLCSGRRTPPHAAPQPGSTLLPRPDRRNGPFCFSGQWSLDPGIAPTGALQQLPLHQHLG